VGPRVELITGQLEYVSDVLSAANARENISNFLIPETVHAALNGDASTPLFNRTVGVSLLRDR
jgi:hypothetical protein